MSTFPPIHRVVTGHGDDGRAIIASSGPLPNVQEITTLPGVVFHEVWMTQSTPAPLDNGADPTPGPIVLSPPPGGTRIRFVDIPPDTEALLRNAPETMHKAFSEVGEVQASTARKNSPHPLMHRTETIDYGILIEGEITLVLDDAEVTLRPGSIVVQRGTNHAWANRSTQMARMAFVLVCGHYVPEVRAALARSDGG